VVNFNVLNDPWVTLLQVENSSGTYLPVYIISLRRYDLDLRWVDEKKSTTRVLNDNNNISILCLSILSSVKLTINTTIRVAIGDKWMYTHITVGLVSWVFLVFTTYTTVQSSSQDIFNRETSWNKVPFATLLLKRTVLKGIRKFVLIKPKTKKRHIFYTKIKEINESDYINNCEQTIDKATFEFVKDGI